MKIPVWVLNQFKKRSRIYIFPTRMGGYLNGLIFLMFLLAVGYNNNLLLIFTLFLFGFNLIWLIQTHFHLNHLKLENILIENGHAGEPIFTSINWKKVPEGPLEWEISFEKREGTSYRVHFPVNSSLKTEGSIILPKRGVWKFHHIRIKTQKPFGLYQVWIYFKVDLTSYAYPEKLKEVPAFEKDHSFLEGENQSLHKGSHDVWNLSPYQGDESRKISWKHYARSGELVIKEGQELTKSLTHFKLLTTSKNKEWILSKIATQMIYCHRTDIAFTLETPQKKFGPGSSAKYLSDCLKELSQC
jgi:uncharacterized protein (DUF58 family)